jgi:hypothetical protein
MHNWDLGLVLKQGDKNFVAHIQLLPLDFQNSDILDMTAEHTDLQRGQLYRTSVKGELWLHNCNHFDNLLVEVRPDMHSSLSEDQVVQWVDNRMTLKVQ